MNTENFNLEPYLKKGLVYVRDAPGGVTFCKPKAYSKLVLVAGVIMIPFFGFGLLLLLFGLFDYLLQSDRYVTISYADLRVGKMVLPQSTWLWPLIAGVLLIAIFGGCMLVVING